jgi:acyl-CoA reductase-like NAD-dependent aldehyde dehydrogenase
MTEYKLLINGKLVAGDNTMTIVNPATEQPVAECPRGSVAQLNEAIAAAKAAFPSWAATEFEHRRSIINKMGDIIEENTDALARTLTQEQGKPLPDALTEVKAMAAFFRYFATLNLSMKVIEDSAERKIEAFRKPLGVVGAIVPWNYPLLLLAFKMPPALIAGNTLVVKPSPTTPLSTLQFTALVADLLPPGVLNVVADLNDLGEALTSHPDIAKISFTGSSATGRRVMASASNTLKRVTLELGGNDAGIVLGDVNPKEVAPKIFHAAFQNSGQVCLALKRLYVHESVYDELCDELVAIAEQTIVGDGLEQGTVLGPLQNKMQYERVRELIEDARKTGNIIAGGTTPDRPGYFVSPTIVRDIADGTRLVDEEQFGPVLPVIKFTDEDDALERANSSDMGLGGSIWSADVDHAYSLAKRMESGTVWINKHIDILPYVPFGGAKASGIGQELGEDGLAEFTQLQVISTAV